MYDDFFLNNHSNFSVIGEDCVTHPIGRKLAEQNFDDNAEADNPIKFFHPKRPNAEPDTDSLISSIRYYKESKYYQDCVAGNAFVAGRTSSLKREFTKPIIYIHGWHTSFKSSISRAAQIGVDLLRSPVIAVSWPSDVDGDPNLHGIDATIDAYERAEREEKLAADLVPFTIGISEDANVTPPAILAHSMGARLFVDAIVGMADDHDIIKKKLNISILAAPDIEMNYFRSIYGKIYSEVDQIVAYCTVDYALFGAQILHGDVRLGQCGPGRLLGMRPEQMVQVIGRTHDPARHSYFLSSQEMLKDMLFLLRNAESARLTNLPDKYPPRQLQLK